MNTVLSGPFERFKPFLDTEYVEHLSDMSQRTTSHQGGGMDLDEMGTFMAQSHSVDLIKLRLIDDCAKESDCDSGPDLFYERLVDCFNSERYESRSFLDFSRELDQWVKQLQQAPIEMLAQLFVPKPF